MTINERIKLIRNDFDLSQNSFADRIGLKHGAISKMEKPGATVTDQNKHIICDKFHVSMHWLNTGNGDMYQETDAEVVDALKEQFGLSPEQKKLMDVFLSMSDEKREAVARAFFDFVDAANAADQPAAAHRKTPTDVKRAIVNSELAAEEKGKTS